MATTSTAVRLCRYYRVRGTDGPVWVLDIVFVDPAKRGVERHIREIFPQHPITFLHKIVQV